MIINTSKRLNTSVDRSAYWQTKWIVKSSVFWMTSEIAITFLGFWYHQRSKLFAGDFTKYGTSYSKQKYSTSPNSLIIHLVTIFLLLLHHSTSRCCDYSWRRKRWQSTGCIVPDLTWKKKRFVKNLIEQILTDVESYI